MLFSKNSHGYVYKWSELSTGKWYIGCRTAKDCHVNDGYICSSKVVKGLITNNSNNWIREILWVGDPVAVKELETEILTSLNAAGLVESYNLHNGGRKFTFTGRRHSIEAKNKISKASSNKVFSDSHRSKIGAKHKGKLVSSETRLRQSIAKKNISEDTRNKMRVNAKNRPSNKGWKMSDKSRKLISQKRRDCSKMQCDFCNRIFDSTSYARFHGDKCKLNPNRKLSSLDLQKLDELVQKRRERIISQEKVMCIFCNKLYDIMNYKRWHGDKCKLNTINTL